MYGNYTTSEAARLHRSTMARCYVCVYVTHKKLDTL